MTIRANDVLIIEHPDFMDTYVIGRAVKDATPTTVQIVYYQPEMEDNGWTKIPKRRNVSHVCGILPAGRDLMKVRDTLKRWKTMHTEAVEAARAVYRAGIKELVS